ncbi:MAG: HAD-IA family hydrolase [Mobilicoccus sp.]|nr:HAD-IA family hydrolase [Mobilicoccus sp.]
MTVPRIAGVLLDMDGTLVDSDAAVERTWTAWALDQGLDPAQVLAACHGETAATTVRRFRPDLDEASVEAHAQAHMEREVIDVEGVVAAPGANDVIATLGELGLPWAVVTNAERRLAQARLGAAGITAPQLVALDDVAAGKPAPDSYLAGAQAIGVPVQACLVVEDSASGVAAGRAARAHVVGLRGVEADSSAGDLADVARLLRHLAAS